MTDDEGALRYSFEMGAVVDTAPTQETNDGSIPFTGQWFSLPVTSDLEKREAATLPQPNYPVHDNGSRLHNILIGLESEQAYRNRKRYLETYDGEHGDLLAVGTRVRVRPDILTTRSKSVRADYVDTGVIERVSPRLKENGEWVYEYPYDVRFDDGKLKNGYAGWELETELPNADH